MSLFGSLFSSVSALAAQSQAMGIISDNISNVNTTGYKGTSARFETLVTAAATDTTFSPGGVRTRPLALIEQQGLIQSSASPLDLAISGSGFFAVNANADSSSTPLYTRAGSFHQDALGNLVNTSGFFLQGYPLDAAGRLPGAPGNTTNTTSSADLASLKTVNVSSINGVAAATTEVSIGANLNATQTIAAGPQRATTIAVATADTDLGLTNGDTFTVTNSSGTLGTFEYNTALGAGQFTTLNQLATLINGTTGLTASVTVGTTAALTVSMDDPREPLTIANGTGTAGAAIFGSSPITVADTYDPTDATKNMASGNVAAHFSRSVRIFDAQGTGHDLQVAFLKVANNVWEVEVYANPASDVTTTAPLVDGQIATGTVSFNGDASLSNVTGGIATPITINWTSGASPSTITSNFGTAGPIGSGQTDGLSQFDGGFNVAFVNQNGSEVGQLNGVTIDDRGVVNASFSNGETQKVFQLPIVTFADVSALEAHSGNVFAQTQKSGQFNLREAGRGGAGLVAPSATEAANVDLGEQFTDMIITKRAFSASSRVITAVDNMLQELIRIRN